MSLLQKLQKKVEKKEEAAKSSKDLQSFFNNSSLLPRRLS